MSNAAGLLREKAVLLVTNQLQYAPEADTVLYLEEGEMVACGKYDDVVQNEGFSSLLNEYEVTPHTYKQPSVLQTLWKSIAL